MGNNKKKPEIDLDNLPESHETVVEAAIDVDEFPKEEYYIESEDEIDDKIIHFMENNIRHSFEYTNYIRYLKTELDLTKCAIMPNIDIKELAVGLEFHHCPLTLYDIVEAVSRKAFHDSNDMPVSMFDIEEQVMLEHYKNHVGLVPLTTSAHEMVHNRSLIVPIDKVNGNYKEFLNEYNDYIPAETKDKVNLMLSAGLDKEQVEKTNSKKLSKTIINYNIKYHRNSNK